jgi:Zn-dependent protease/predicted transcriptional regulator
MESQIKLGRIFGIRVGLHYSWFIIAILVTLSLAGQFYLTNPDWNPVTVWTTSLITSILFFAALLTHELSHSIVARLKGLPVRGITLFALGGVSEMEKDAPDPQTEFLVGAIGPLTSAAIGLLCLALAVALGWTPIGTAETPAIAILVWLGYINFVLAIFNMIPGFPLDGGRVLRAIIWWLTGNEAGSTRVAAVIGHIVALCVMALGIFGFFAGRGFGALWLVFVGWFLFDAARSSYQQVGLNELLKEVRVYDAMARDCLQVDYRLNLQKFVDDVVMRTGRRCFLAMENEKVVGLVTPQEIKNLDKRRWEFSAVSDIMKPIYELRTIEPDAPLMDALDVMGREDLNQLPVTRDGRLEGIISRNNILQLLQNRADLKKVA